MARKVFLTGITGFLGSALALKLMRQRSKVIALVRQKNDVHTEERVFRILKTALGKPDPSSEYSERLEIIKGDVTQTCLGMSSREFMRIAKDVDQIFHCAASTKFNDEDSSWKVNVEGTKNVLELFRQSDADRFIYISTAYICGRRKGIVLEDELDMGQDFRNPYERTKLEAEKLVREMHEQNWTIFRPSIIIGDSCTGWARNFHQGIYPFLRALISLKSWVEKDLKNGGYKSMIIGAFYKDGRIHVPVRILGLPEARKNLVPIDYVTDAIIAICRRKDAYGRTYHIVNPDPPTLKEINEWVNSMLGLEGPSVVHPEGLRKDSLKEWEKRFFKDTMMYEPYMEDEPIFDNSNTRIALQGSSIQCPRISYSLIETLIRYAISSRWGKKYE